MLSPLYISEVSPPELRGSLMALEQFSIVLGCVLGFWTGFATRNGAYSILINPTHGFYFLLFGLTLTSSVPGSPAWRIPLGVQIIPGIFLGVGRRNANARTMGAT